MKKNILIIVACTCVSLSGFSCKPSSTRTEYLDTAVRHNTQLGSYELEVVAEGLHVPWSIVFTSPTRMLVTERSGAVRAIINGKLEPAPITVAIDAKENREAGLMGITLDPDYAANKHIYLCFSTATEVKVMRFTDNGTSFDDGMLIIGKIPTSSNHAGGRIRFGPDGKLYISTGDAKERQEAQTKTNLYGKILRLNKDGSTPTDNPFGNEVWSYGHRNPQGFDWHTSGVMYSTEHGPSFFDGKSGGDEVNIIDKGNNYGWPEISHRETRTGMLSPLLEYTPAIAPASGMFYTGTMFPEFRNNFFFGCLRGQGLMRIVLSEDSPRTVASHQLMKEVDVGRVRDVAQGPDGAIYISTSNTDGRGDVRNGDDKIYRLIRKK